MRRLIIPAAAVLVVALVAVAGRVWWPHLPPVGPAVPSLNAAIVRVTEAVGDAGVVEVDGLTPATPCRQELVAKGHRFTRTAEIYVNASQTQAVQDSVRSEAGVEVSEVADGWLNATATSACLAGTAPAPVPSGTVPPDLAAIFTALGTSSAGYQRETFTADGCAITVQSAISGQTGTTGIADRLKSLLPAGATVIATPANRLIWRAGRVGTVVAASDAGTQVTIQRTELCS